MDKEYDYGLIKCAAIRKGEVIISGYRHDDCYRNLGMFKEMDETWAEWEQGFITLDNNFKTREEAAKIAFEKGQIKNKKTLLFSEDLY